jgi:hypothetical protein
MAKNIDGPLYYERMGPEIHDQSSELLEGGIAPSEADILAK